MRPEELFNVKPLGKKEQFQFRCIRCGDCCRGVKESVMLESLDAYRLAKFLRQIDPSVKVMENMLARYADPMPLTDTGFPIYVLKTIGHDDVCIFLKESGCAAYAARPRTCRLYPITVGPGERDLEYLLCSEKPHHFVGGSVRAKDWLRKNFKREDQEFLHEEYKNVAKLGRLINKIPEECKTEAIIAMLFARYYNFNLDVPFMPQFRSNMKQLEEQLANIGAHN